MSSVNVEIKPEDFKILIVDDLETNVLLLQVLLKKMQYKLAVAYNGMQAIEKVESERPDLILLDVMMPELDGFETAKRLKSNDFSKDIPIIFLTALDSANDIVKGFQIGASDYVTKPFKKEELLVRVSHQISIIAARRMIEQQNEELLKTIAGRDKLYSVIAHDLRSPIATLKMVLNMLVLNVDSDIIGEEMFEMLNMSNKTLEEVFALLDNLLKWTKSNTGRLNVVSQVFDLVATIEGIMEIFTLGAQTKSINLHAQLPERLSVYADTDMINTVIRNLISNAMKFTPRGGEVLVSAESDGNLVTVKVKDTGCGISKENQQKLLNLNTHFSTYGTENEEGSGLGLLLCADFVKRNNGDFWFESEEGKGSTFIFTVPCHENSN